MVAHADPPPLFVEFKNYALAIVYRAGMRFPWLLDDFCSDVLLALWRLGTDGNVKAGHMKGLVAFITHRAMNERVKIERRKNPAAFRRAGPVRNDDGTEAEAVSMLPDPREPADDGAGFEELLARIPDPDVRDLARRRFRDDATFDALGSERGITGTAVHQRVTRAVRKLAASVR